MAQETPMSPKKLLLLHGTLLLYSLSSVLAKVAGVRMAGEDFSGTLIFLSLEFFALALYSLLWQQVLKRMPLNVAYSSKGVCTLWTCLFGILLFQEPLTIGKALGMLLVLGGVYLVVSDHE